MKRFINIVYTIFLLLLIAAVGSDTTHAQSIKGNLKTLQGKSILSVWGNSFEMGFAHGCKREYHRPLTLLLWMFAEVAIAATDLAEVIGTIIGLNLLFRLPLIWGCLVVAFDTFLRVLDCPPRISNT